MIRIPMAKGTLSIDTIPLLQLLSVIALALGLAYGGCIVFTTALCAIQGMSDDMISIRLMQIVHASFDASTLIQATSWWSVVHTVVAYVCVAVAMLCVVHIYYNELDPAFEWEDD